MFLLFYLQKACKITAFFAYVQIKTAKSFEFRRF